jgi:preprotein translocase subunit YajC
MLRFFLPLCCCLACLTIAGAADDPVPAMGAAPAATGPVATPSPATSAPASDEPTPETPPKGDPPPSTKPTTPGFDPTWIIFIAIAFLVFMIFSQSRNQKRERRARELMLESIKIGDRVVTIGGLHGEIARKGEGTVDLKINELTGVVTYDIAAIAKVNPGATPLTKN